MLVWEDIKPVILEVLSVVSDCWVENLSSEILLQQIVTDLLVFGILNTKLMCGYITVNVKAKTLKLEIQSSLLRYARCCQQLEAWSL